MIEMAQQELVAPFDHPGAHLQDMLEDLGVSAGQLAKALGVERQRVEKLIRGERAITADTALRLARVVGASPEFWLALQASYELSVKRAANGDRYAALAPLQG